MNINQFFQEDELVKIIDPTKKEVIGIFNSYAEAGKKLQMSPRVIKAAAFSKTKRFCTKLDKEIAIRVVSKSKVGAI